MSYCLFLFFKLHHEAASSQILQNYVSVDMEKIQKKAVMLFWPSPSFFALFLLLNLMIIPVLIVICSFSSGYPTLNDIGHNRIAAHAVIPAESADNFSRGKQTGNRFILLVKNLSFGIDLQAAHRMMHTWNDRRCIEWGGKQLVLFVQDRPAEFRILLLINSCIKLLNRLGENCRIDLQLLR